MESLDHSQKPIANWVTYQAIVGAGATVVVAFVAGWFAVATKSAEVEVKRLELAIGILTNHPTPETLALREWAVTTVNKSGPVELSLAAQDELMKRRLQLGPTLSGSVTTDAASVSGSMGSAPSQRP